MCTSKPKIPDPPPEPPRRQDEGVKRARSDELRRQRSAFGASSTLLTGPLGVTGGGPTTSTALLGGS